MSTVSGELTYTSFDAPGAAGGWQVKEQRGFADPGLREHVIQRIRTRGLAPAPLPPFPTAEQRAALPRTLVYGRHGRTGVWWHTVAAGLDGSGRPGNVFAHVLAAEQDGSAAVRPVEWWASPGWLTPYGPAEVSASVLGPRPPEPGPAAGRVAALEWLADADRLDQLGVLLDRLAEAEERTVPLVLLVPDESSAVRWVGALSQVLALPQAAALTFSTSETAARVRGGEADELALVCLAGSEADALPDSAPGVRVDLRGTGPVGALSRWARLARSAVAEPALLELMDLAVPRAGGAGSDPAWPLAMAHLWYLDGEEEVADPELLDLRTVAAEVVLGGSPDGLAADAELLRVVTDALGALSPGAEGSWALLRPHLDVPATVPTRLLADIHTDRLLADPTALAEAQRGPRLRYPAPSWWGGRLPVLDPDRVAALAREQRTGGHAPAVARLATLLGLAQLLVATDGTAPDGFDEELIALLQEVWRTGDPGWLDGIGPVPEPVARIAREAFDSDERVRHAPPGQAAAPELLRWLFPPPGPTQRPRTRAEVEYWLGVPARERSEPVVLALLGWLRVPAPGTDLDTGRRLLEQLADRPWTARGLGAAGEAELAVVPEHRLEELLLSETDSADLRTVLDRLWRAGRVPGLTRLRLDTLVGATSRFGLDVPGGRSDPAGLLRRLAAAPLPPDLVTLAQTLLLDATLCGVALPTEAVELAARHPELTVLARRWLEHRPERRHEVYRVLLSDPRMRAADDRSGSAAHGLRRDDQPALQWWVQERRLGRDQLASLFHDEYRRAHRRAPEERVVSAVVRSYASRQGVADLLRRRPWGER